MKEIILKPAGCPRAGFYADLGHYIIDSLVILINQLHRDNILDYTINIDCTNAWLNYKTDTSIDLYKELFKQNEKIKIPIPFSGIHRDNTTIIKKEDFTNLNFLLARYFTPSDSQYKLIQNLIHVYNIDFNNTIGVYYRSTDKISESQIPSINQYFNIIDEILSQNNKLKIFIQTDQKQVRDAFKDNYKQNCFYIEEIPVTETSQGVHFIYEDKLHLVRYLEAVVRILSRCKYLIANTSNVTTFIGAYRNNSKNVYQFYTDTNLIK